MKVYERIHVPGTSSGAEDPKLLVKFRVFLADRPGSLAGLSNLITESRGNISFFHYDRSVQRNRVVIESQFSDRTELESLLQALRDKNYDFEEIDDQRDELQITTLESVLEIKVRLINRPGSLAAFASLLKEYRANVTYMLYDENIDAESADIALATESTVEIDRLLSAINSKGYQYKVVYRGTGQEEVEHVIGLNLVEKFFLNLKKLLSDRDLEELRTVVRSSQELCDDLISFYSEVGNHLERGDVFANVLALASMSISKVGGSFYARELPTLRFNNNIQLFTFRLPTGANIFVFQHDDELTMFDAAYGLYYEDIKALLRKKSLNPARLKRIFVSHPDADHIGAAGYFAQEFGTEVFLHPGGQGVIENENRAYGTDSRLLELNKRFTRLVSKFTKCKYPEKISFFSISRTGAMGDFNVIDAFPVGSLKFQVLESHGGHTPGQVFFLNKDHGLLFTSDYLISIDSLSTEDRDNLSVPRYLMTSTNSNSRVFRKEGEALRNLALGLDAELKHRDKFALIFAGHGDYYRADLFSEEQAAR